MLDCNACIRRLIRTVFADISHTPRYSKPHTPFLSSIPSQRTPPWQGRRYATTATAAQAGSQRTDGSLQDRDDPRRRSVVGKGREFKRTALEQELVYLRDPVKLAGHTVGLLRQSAPNKALELVRLGSKRMACTVSWNHLIDYEMSQGRVNSAMKLYNEMKKRAQPLDALTYTIILRGLSWATNVNYPQTVSRAVTVYNSMYAGNCPVKPNIIHTNAVLKVCALAKDLDALWGVAAKLPSHGNAAPNNLTFTTILNAIRTVAWDDSSKYNKDVEETSQQKNARRQQAVLQGRKMWDEIIARWRTGDIVIDEELVCSMGRLLLLGYRESDYEDIRALLEQTMGIPRQLPGRDAYPEQIADVASPAGSDVTLQVSPHSEAPPLTSTSDQESELDLAPGGEFDPLPVSNSRNLHYARPGNNTLSLSIDACIRLRATRAAQDYWGLLTSPDGPYKIAPDSENYHMYLRLLRLQRASRLAVELVKEMKEGTVGGGRRDLVQAKTFRIAMSCCVRDQNNQNSMEHAQALIHLMTDTLEQPDVRALEMYLIVLNHRKDWRAMKAALQSTEVCVRNLRSLLAYGDKYEIRQRDKEEIEAFVRRLVRSYDLATNLGKEGMTRQERQRMMEVRNRLVAWLTRQTNRRIRMSERGRGRESAEGGENQEEGDERGAEREEHDMPRDLGTTENTHLPRGRRAWAQYQPDGQRFENDESDSFERSANGRSDVVESAPETFDPNQGKGWKRWRGGSRKVDLGRRRE